MKTQMLLASILSLVAAGTTPAPAFAAGGPGDNPLSGSTSQSLIAEIRSAYREGDDEKVVVLADRALLDASRVADLTGAVPELHFWRGAALRRLGRHKEALVALERAKRYGLEASELYLEEALTYRAMGQDEDAQRAYDEAERFLPDDLERRARIAARWQLRERDEPTFQFWFTPQLGYDTNVIGVDEDTLLTQGDLERESFYAGARLFLKYNLIEGEEQYLSLDYANTLRWFEEESELSYTDNVFGVTARYPVLESIEFEIRGTFAEAFTDGDGHLRTTRTVTPSFLWEIESGLQARFSGTWSRADYYDGDVPNPQDRDGDTVGGGFALGISLGANWSIAPALEIVEYSTEGDDYDHRAVAGAISLVTAEYLGSVYSIGASYRRADYDNLNSVANFGKKREDRIVAFSVTITIRALEESIGFAPNVRISFMDHNSNVDAFDYDRWVPHLELGILGYSF